MKYFYPLVLLLCISCKKETEPIIQQNEILLIDAITQQPVPTVFWQLNRDNSRIALGASDKNGICSIPNWKPGFEFQIFSNEYKYQSVEDYNKRLLLKPYVEFILEVDTRSQTEPVLVWGSVDPTGFHVLPNTVQNIAVQHAIPDSVYIRVAYGNNFRDTLFFANWYDAPDSIHLTIP